MSRSGTNFSAKEVLLRLQRLLSRLRTIPLSEDGGEEREYLLAGEYPTPNAQPLHHLSPPPQLEIKGFPISDLDDTTLTQQYAAMVQELLSSLPYPYRLLSPEDVKLVSEHPIAAGRFANLLVGTYKGRKVGLKEYRCYVSFDINQVVAVCYNRCSCCIHR